MAMSLNELTVDADIGFRVREWNAEPGDWQTRPMAPVMIFTAAEIAHCLRHGPTTWDLGTLEVTESGYATATLDGRDYVYELFPARFGDQWPYEPPIYVGRWPD